MFQQFHSTSIGIFQLKIEKLGFWHSFILSYDLHSKLKKNILSKIFTLKLLCLVIVSFVLSTTNIWFPNIDIVLFSFPVNFSIISPFSLPPLYTARKSCGSAIWNYWIISSDRITVQLLPVWYIVEIPTVRKITSKSINFSDM